MRRSSHRGRHPSGEVRCGMALGGWLRQLALLLLLGWLWPAQAATYTFKSDTYSWESTSNTITWDQACTGYPKDDDKATVAFTGGFSFPFAGSSYGSVRVMANGMLQFGPDVGLHRTYTNTTLPIAAVPSYNSGCGGGTPAAVLLVYWTDLDPGRSTSGGVTWEIKGTAPNRRFVVTWNNVYQYNTTTPYTFQAVLYESGEFKYQYGNANASGSNATIGVEVNSSDYTLYSFNSGYNANGSAIRWFVPSGTPDKLAEYRMDEYVWNGTAGEVVDSTGKGFNGVRVGSTTATSPIAQVCRSLNVPANTTAAINAVDTALDVDSAVGSSGTIGFWLREATAWNSGTAAMLFDATSNATFPFYLMRNSTGSLRFAVSDAAGAALVATTANRTTAASTWVHVAVTWRLASGTNQSTVRIYVNGVLAATTPGTTTGQLSGTLNSVFIGDNRGTATPSGATVNSANGLIDEVQVYNYELSGAELLVAMAATHGCPPPLDHVELVPSNTSGSTCAATPVTLRACSNANCSALLASYTGTVTLSSTTGRGAWTAGSADAPQGTLAGGSDNDGGATYTFAAGDLGQVSLNFAHTLAQDVQLTAVDTSLPASATTTSGIAFRDNVFSFAEDLSSLIAGSDLAVAGRPHDMTLSLIKKDPSTGSCGVATDFSGTRNLKLWRTDSGTTGSWTAPGVVSPALTIPAAKPAASNLALAFASGVARFNLGTTDIGRYALSVADDSLSYASTSIGGASNTLTVRPFALVVQAIKQGSTQNPNGSAATDTVFAQAGSSFQATVGAYRWTAAMTGNGTDANNDGVPDSGATLANTTAGGLAPSFNSSLTLSPLAASQTPASGVLGTLANATVGTWTGGSAAPSTLQYSEVGSFMLATSGVVSNFLGSGLSLDAIVFNSAGVQNTRVGRFIPAGFAVSGSAVSYRPAAACTTASTFNYLDEPFTLGFTLTAKNALGATTANYTGAFARFDPTAASNFALAGISGSTVFNTSAPARLVLGSATGAWANGVASGITLTAQATRATAADGPFPAALFGIAPVDSDGVKMLSHDLDTGSPATSSNHTQLASLVLRHGRLRLLNAIGAADHALSLPLQAQYWNGSAWAPNTLDSCTKVPATAVNFGNYRRTLTATDTNLAATSTTLSSGQASLVLNAPTATHRGSVDVALSLGSSAADVSCLQPWTPGTGDAASAGANLAYLRGAWCGAASDKDPSARASFGLYRGADPLIFSRENY
ncbi:MAG TPA: LamG domain-containing protein [Ideonella sp.]|nr:LamG domain-containing protein [Ideonella sp.]